VDNCYIEVVNAPPILQPYRRLPSYMVIILDDLNRHGMWYYHKRENGFGATAR
jgi:hypothetical protein